MSDAPQKTFGTCPVCSAPIPDGKFGGGIWRGSVKSKVRSGPFLTVVCPGCAARLIACATSDELEQGRVRWEVEEQR